MVGKFLLDYPIIFDLKLWTAEYIVDLKKGKHFVMGNSPTLALFLKGVFHSLSNKIYTIRHRRVIEITHDNNRVMCRNDMIVECLCLLTSTFKGIL